MKYAQFIERVAGQAQVTLGQAEALTTATLQTLAERISGGEARDLAAQLPKELQGPLDKKREPAEAFDVNEFIRRVSTRAGTDLDTAGRGARSVFQTLNAAVTTGEFEDVLSQLPKQFRELIPAVARQG
jgi:uncharacterized protein (DUF2267 family)